MLKGFRADDDQIIVVGATISATTLPSTSVTTYRTWLTRAIRAGAVDWASIFSAGEQMVWRRMWYGEGHYRIGIG